MEALQSTALNFGGYRYRSPSSRAWRTGRNGVMWLGTRLQLLSPLAAAQASHCVTILAYMI